MFVAFDVNEGRNVDADFAVRNPTHQYICPCCDEKVILRNGRIKVAHFAHVAGCDCDDFSHDMSAWHRDWQRVFPPELCEVPFELNGRRHRADFAWGDIVVEFQHSPISAEEFDRRNRFYNACGCVVYWVFDVRDPLYNGRMRKLRQTESSVAMFGWKHKWKRLRGILPQRSKNVVIMFDCLPRKAVMRVTWAIDDDGVADYRRFFARYVGTAVHFKELLKREYMKRRRTRRRLR